MQVFHSLTAALMLTGCCKCRPAFKGCFFYEVECGSAARWPSCHLQSGPDQSSRAGFIRSLASGHEFWLKGQSTSQGVLGGGGKGV